MENGYTRGGVCVSGYLGTLTYKNVADINEETVGKKTVQLMRNRGKTHIN